MEKSKKLYQRSAKQADKMFWVTEIVCLGCLVFVLLVADNEVRELVAWIILALMIYQGTRRVIKGPPVGVAMVERAGDMLIFRNASSVPPKVDRIPIDRIHSIRMMGERMLRYFDCTLTDGKVQRVGPFERGQGELVVAEWFYEVLPDTSFMVDPSATPMAQLEERPPGL